MVSLRIVCTDQVPVSEPTTHAHIVSVGVDTNNDGRAEEQHSLSKVITAIDSNLTDYYTYGPTSHKIAHVQVVNCPHKCGKRIIKSTPDSVKDNNLDYLRRCSWQ